MLPTCQHLGIRRVIFPSSPLNNIRFRFDIACWQQVKILSLNPSLSLSDWIYCGSKYSFS